MSDPRRDLGTAGEKLAERFLKRRGLRTITRNYRTPVGELDLVMRDGDTVVFVEVKSLSSDELAAPHEQLRPKQQAHLLKAARWFVNHKHLLDKPLRYDVVGITFDDAADPVITHYPDAFTPKRW